MEATDKECTRNNVNYKLITYGGGGIFSIFMDLVVVNVYRLDIEKFYIEVRDNQYNPPEDCFSFVFDQEYDEEYRDRECRNRAGFRKKGMSLGAIEDFEWLDMVKECCKKFDIKKEILNRVMSIPSNTLGVHFRGGDMDNKHPQYGIVKYIHYRRKMAKLKFDNIFIASDNNEVIERIKSEFWDIPVYYYNFTRAKTIEQDTYKVQMDNSSDPLFWQEAFVEMLTLSKCSSLLCRVSGLANAAIAFSDTLTKIHRL